MNVLVTGGAGMLGREIVRQLLEKEYTVRVLDLQSLADEFPSVEWITGSVADADAVMQACEGMDAVMHTVALIFLTWEQGIAPFQQVGYRRCKPL
ncbi:MAG: NAD-dependent epimerase/dehydratase family protein, partial [Chloroflexota bacterium]